MRAVPSRLALLSLAVVSATLVSCPPTSSELHTTAPNRALKRWDFTSLEGISQAMASLGSLWRGDKASEQNQPASPPAGVAVRVPSELEALTPIEPEEESNPPPPSSWPTTSASSGTSPLPADMPDSSKSGDGSSMPTPNSSASIPSPTKAPNKAPVATQADPGTVDEKQQPASNGAPDRSPIEPTPPLLTATAKQTWIYSRPSRKSRRIGYLRAGAVVARKEKPAGRRGCKGGWYGIEPMGYVCVGRAAALRGDGPIARAAAVRADRSQGLPYIYGMSKYPPPPLYVRLPSQAEQREQEGKAMPRRRGTTGFEDVVGPAPEPLVYGRVMPSLEGKSWGNKLVSGVPAIRSGFGILQVFEWTDRLFGVTTDLKLIPVDRLKRIRGSNMQGIHLEPGQGLPVAFVRSRVARLYRIDPDTRAVQQAGPIAFRQGFALTGKRLRIGKKVFLETRAGTYIEQTDRVVIIPPMKNVPGWAKRGRKWVDVSILRQTLVAYEGTRPVFATLVSTGVDGLGDPEETHSTIRGVFLIHTKHVSVTMDNDEEGDVYDLRDVPYVQYFMDGYALHAAYWHDSFGTPHSHGCINLAPKDAAWLFRWTDPKVPRGWHGRLQLRGGTIVYTHA